MEIRYEAFTSLQNVIFLRFTFLSCCLGKDINYITILHLRILISVHSWIRELSDFWPATFFRSNLYYRVGQETEEGSVINCSKDLSLCQRSIERFKTDNTHTSSHLNWNSLFNFITNDKKIFLCVFPDHS